jgi:hypothetical protein
MRNILIYSLLGTLAATGWAQPEMMQWGNLRGIRTEGQLQAFETSLQVLRPNGSLVTRTGHYAHKSAYTRRDSIQRVELELGSLKAVETVEASDPGAGRLEVTMIAVTDAESAGGYLVIDLPHAGESGARLKWLAPTNGQPPVAATMAEILQSTASSRAHVGGLRIEYAGRSFELRMDTAAELEVKAALGPEGSVQILVPVLVGPVRVGQAASRKLELRATGDIDHAPANIALDITRPGSTFAGVGGNFRLQFPASDPAIIDYKLANLRVTWTRIALWWRDWDPDESGDPLAAARAGRLTDRLRNQMTLARRLAALGLPVIVSVWDPPAWANQTGPRRPGMYTDAVNPAKGRRMAESIAAYLQFLKENQGVEAALFSFNEPDLGLVPEPADHVAFIKLLGRECVARGLATKHLLADTSNATQKSLGYVRAAISDPEARSFLGAVGFHSWGGCEDENLLDWAEAARQLGLPLMVTEAGPDAEAHRHPDLFLEPAYALDEIQLYVRLLALARPLTLMHWQLTADYSLLKGGGAYGHAGPLEPTQRFWNYRQLSMTPPGAFALPVRSDHPEVTPAAFGAIARGEYAIHLVNAGATRTAKLSGLPSGLKSLRVVATDPAQGGREMGSVPVREGRAEVPLTATSFTSAYGTSTEDSAL